MSVSLRHTRTGLIALAAAGLFAAGTVGMRANELHADMDGQELDPSPRPVSPVAQETVHPDCDADCS